MIPLICFASLFLGGRAIDQAAPRTLNVWVSRNVSPSSKIRLNINTRNIPVVHVNCYAIPGLSWLGHPESWEYRPKPDHPAVNHFDLTIASKGQVLNPTDNFYSRQVNLPPMKSGVYLLDLSGRGESSWAVVTVTNLNIVTKRSPYRTLVWVTRYKTGAVVKDAKINIFGDHGKRCYSAQTGSDGTALIPMPPSQDNMVVQDKDDMAGLSIGAENPNGHLKCLFQTDRPIYRPGQTISFKAILRLTHDHIYETVRNAEVNIQLRDPRDNPLDQTTRVTNEVGSVAGAFKIPQEGMLGAYTVVLTRGIQRAYQTFTVAAYRKPEYKVDVKAMQKRYLSGQDIHFSVDTAYYFGAPVPQAQVRWVVRRNDSPFSWESPEDRWFYSGDGNMYPRNTFASSPYTGEGEGVTDNHGHLDIPIHTDPEAPDSTYSVSLTVIDSSRRQVTGSASVPVFTSELRLGIACQRQTVAIGDLIPIQVHLSDLDGRPKSGVVQFRVVTQIWNEKEGVFKPKILTQKSITVPTTGTTTITLPALAYGSVSIQAVTTDATGRKSRAEEDVWVASLDYKEAKEVESPNLELRLDKRHYLPGQKVHAYAITNRPKHPVLFVLSGGDIWAYKVVDSHRQVSMWTFDTNTTQSPNAFVTVDQWNESGMQSGNAVVPLPDRSRLLTVQIKPDKSEYKPGETANYQVRTLDQDGHGVASEVAVSVVDEAIYALSQDITPDPYSFYWGIRSDQVQSFQSSPEELSGGAFQNVSSVAPVRRRFEDTAYWSAFVHTDRDGNGKISFEMPGNLTSWRTTARAVTGDTRVGSTFSNVTATRPVTLRLATPRIVAQGDQLTLIGTVNNRSDRPMRFEVNLRAAGVAVSPQTKQELTIPAKSEGSVRWQLKVKEVPVSGVMDLTARVGAIGTSNPDYGDALNVTVPVVPRGVAETVLIGGTVAKSGSTRMELPSDTLSQGSLITIKVSGGVQEITRESAARLMANGRYGTMWAVNALKAAVAVGAPKDSDDVREAFALLSRDQTYDGWGWWEGAPVDAKITAEVGYALAIAEKHGYTVFPNIKAAAVSGCTTLYARTNLWEDRARLAASLKFLGSDRAAQYIPEVVERGLNLSPFSKLRMAEALAGSSPIQAQNYLDNVLTLVSEGPASSYVPVGFGIGWSASETETTAQLLTVLNVMNQQKGLQSRLARRLAIPERNSYRCPEDSAAVVRALSLYGHEHPDAKSIGVASVAINGKVYSLAHSTIDQSASVEIRDSILHGSTNSVEIKRDGDGEAFYSVQARVYRPSLSESTFGVRAARRFEMRNEAGVWTEVAGIVKPGEPVRCTVVVWGDDVSDALKVTEPIPAGFEFIDSDYTAYSREEVRDGSVAHYLLNSGTPTYFRYYIRAEADGKLIALPATAEYLRRPATRGHSSAQEIEVHP